jgi:hypothetical protein
MTDSPWFWAYLFGTGALVALALAGPKFGPRQAQIEREYQGRTRAAQTLNNAEPNVEMSTAERTLVTLRPLFLGLAVLTTIAWMGYWFTRRRNSGGATGSGLTSSPDHGTPQRAFPTVNPDP